MSYKAVLNSIEYFEKRVASTSDTAFAYTKQFNLGKRTLLDVLDTSAEVINAKKDLLNAHYDGLYAQFRILNGIGRLVASLQGEWSVESQAPDEEKGSKIIINEDIETIERFDRDSFIRSEPQKKS